MKPNHVVRWHRAIRWLLGMSALLFVLCRFVPWAPSNHYGIIDASWMQALHVAFIEHWQFGRDIVFTFGPWGFLEGGYDPATHLVSVIVWTILSVVFWWAGWRAARLCFNQDLLAWLWLMAFSDVAAVEIFLNLDVRLIGLVLLLLLLHFFAEDRPFSITQASLVVSLGLLSLVKFSILITGGVAVVVIATDNIWRQRRLPWILPVFGASLLFFWCMARQRLSSFVPFIRNTWGVSSGYIESLGVTKPTEMGDVCVFLAAAGLLGALAGYVAWRRHRFAGILPLAALGFVLFAAFKYGYVRYDGHEVTATTELLMVALTCQAMAWSPAQKVGRWALLSTFVPTMAILLFTSVTFGRHSRIGFIPVLARTLNIEQIVAPLGLFGGGESLPEMQEKYLAGIRNQFPLPQIEGSVDVYPWNQEAIFAHGLRYQPRPIIQSYSAYSPGEEEMNADHLRNTLAPDHILFAIAPIDNHYPALEDGRSWPDLLTRYDIKSADGPFLLLTRSAIPRKYQMVPIEDTAIPFGKPLALPAVGDGPIWAEIDIDQTLSGIAISMLYKPPPLSLTIYLRDGREGDFRLVPGMARSGFLLSPFIGDPRSFALLAARDGLRALANMDVDSIIISVANDSGGTACYQSPIRLRLYRLDYPRQDLRQLDEESNAPSASR